MLRPLLSHSNNFLNSVWQRKISVTGLINGNENYSIDVIDILRMGLKFCTEEVLDLNHDDKVVIEFILDDADGSKISKDVIIRKIDKEYIGAEFLYQSHYDNFGKDLLFNFG